MVRPGERREIARWMATERDFTCRQAARCCSISQGCYWYRSRRHPDHDIVNVLQRLAASRPRWGFGLMFDWIRSQGRDWNHKRVYRVYKELALNLRIKPKKRIPSRNPTPLDEAKTPNAVWSADFMSDSLTDGRTFRTFNVIDDHNRESLAIEVDHSLPSERVVRVLDQVAEERGYPGQLRTDNGPEFTAQTLAAWAEDHDVKLAYIAPGKPTQNAYVERFNRTFREEVLDVYSFSDLDEVRDESTRFQHVYNHERPHRSLDRKTPMQYLEDQRHPAGDLPPRDPPVVASGSRGGRTPQLA